MSHFVTLQLRSKDGLPADGGSRPITINMDAVRFFEPIKGGSRLIYFEGGSSDVVTADYETLNTIVGAFPAGKS